METTAEKTFTDVQIENWRTYEYVRQEGRFNMLSAHARYETGMDHDEYFFVVNNYDALKEAAEKAA